MTRFFSLLLATGLLLGCDSLKGPHQGYVVPAVAGRVVAAPSGEPLEGATIERHLAPPRRTDPFAEKGAQQLMRAPYVRADSDGQFRMAPVKDAYLLFERPGAYQFTLVVRHADYQTLTTNIDLLTIKPVTTNDVLTVFVGDLRLQSQGR